MNKTLVFCLISVVLLSAGAAKAEPPHSKWADSLFRFDHQYWVEAGQPTEELDLYAYMGSIVLHSIDGDLDRDDTTTTQLVWVPHRAQFNLVLRDQWVSDLETGEDEWGRPTFAGLFDPATHEPQVTGLLNLAPGGGLIVEVNDLTSPSDIISTRYLAGAEGFVIQEGQCKCPFIGGSICVKADCDTSASCDTNYACTWYPVPLEDSFDGGVSMETDS